MLEVTKDNFAAEVERAETPVLLDFWASWCGPCRMLAPVVEELAGEFEEKVKFGKVNVDEQPELAMRYGVQSIPTLILFRGGEPVNASVGVVPAETIRAMLG